MDFSWTWKENRKKTREELTWDESRAKYEQCVHTHAHTHVRAHTHTHTHTHLTSARRNLCGVGFHKRFNEEGTRAARVVAAVSLTTADSDSIFLSFTTTDSEHQILETLSSYRPRKNGNSRLHTCRVRFQFPRNGYQQTTNVQITARPRKTIFLARSLLELPDVQLLPRR